MKPGVFEPISPEVAFIVEEEAPQELQILIEYLPPVFKQVLRDIEVVEGERAVFEVEVEGHEPITVTWTHEEVDVKVGMGWGFWVWCKSRKGNCWMLHKKILDLNKSYVV